MHHLSRYGLSFRNAERVVHRKIREVNTTSEVISDQAGIEILLGPDAAEGFILTALANDNLIRAIIPHQ
jgi:hypothetical protein